MRLALTFQVRHGGYRARRVELRSIIARACKAALEEQGVRQAALSVVLADDAAIQALNRDFRGKDKPTNVLSFPGDDSYLGDVMMSLDTIAREAQEQRKAFEDHTAHLAVHACLHLLGYDHESEREAAEMEEIEVKILQKLNVANPYL